MQLWRFGTVATAVLAIWGPWFRSVFIPPRHSGAHIRRFRRVTFGCAALRGA